MLNLRLSSAPRLLTEPGLFAFGGNMSQPSKEQVRKWLDKQITAHKLPPTPKQIRRELGWGLLEAERSQKRRY